MSVNKKLIYSLLMELNEAVIAVRQFAGEGLTKTLSRIEHSIQGKTMESASLLYSGHYADGETLAAAGLVKQLAGQVNVTIHALGILLCLPHVLEPDEVIESISLGAGNTGKQYDLETNSRIAEFKFIAWQEARNTLRQNSIFKDFYYLAEDSTQKSKHLYVLGTMHSLKFLTGKRAISSVLSRNVGLSQLFRTKHPECLTVRDYYLPRKDLVSIEDVACYLPALAQKIVEIEEV